MDTKDILLATESAKRLIQDDNYYKYIFKKTERIVSVIFYVLHNVESNRQNEKHIEDIEHAARTVHDAVLHSLQTRAHVAEDVVRAVGHALVALESKLVVAQVCGVIERSVLAVFHNEIEAVLRGMKKYIGEEEKDLFTTLDTTPSPVERRVTERPATARTATLPTTAQAATPTDRRTRILTILEARGESTIKDISEIITDVSEKTIQRELNAMIDENLVKRQGERRWSKYSIF